MISKLRKFLKKEITTEKKLGCKFKIYELDLIRVALHHAILTADWRVADDDTEAYADNTFYSKDKQAKELIDKINELLKDYIVDES